MDTSTDPVCEREEPFLDALFRDEYVPMVQLAHLLTGSNIGAEDIVQEAFLRIDGRLDELTNAGGYLRATVVNLSRNWQRRQSRRRVREERVGSLSVNNSQIEQSERHDDLLAVVDGLPFRQRAVLVARYWLDLPEAEIAQLLGCRPGTVKSLNARALDALRKGLS